LISKKYRLADVSTIAFWAIAGSKLFVLASHPAAAQSVIASGDVVPYIEPSPTWTVGGDLEVGQSGVGELYVLDGGTVDMVDGTIGLLTGSFGEVFVSGQGSTWTSDLFLTAGSAGRGVLRIDEGGSAVSFEGFIGTNFGSNGTVTVTGTGSSWTNTSNLWVGFGGTGTLTIENGGEVTSTRGVIGELGNSSGTVTVSGAGSRWSNSTDLLVADSGIGVLTIADGGTVTVGGDDGIMTLARSAGFGDSPGATGTVNIGAAADNAPAAAGTLAASSVVFGAGTGTIVFNHTGNPDGSAYEFAPSISGDGTIRHIAGHTTLSGANSNTGETRLEGGILTLGSDSALGGSILHTLGSTVDYADGVTIANGIVIESDTTQFQVLSGLATQAGIVSEAGGSRPFEKIGAGELVLTAANSWTGQTLVREGTLTVDGGSIEHATSRLVVGQSSGENGALIVSNSGTVTNSFGDIGLATGSTGEATITGAGSNWTNTSDLAVGGSGTGTLTVAAGGAVSNRQGFVGRFSDSTGTVVITGPGSTWTNTISLFVGVEGTGAVTIADGGAVDNAAGNVGRIFGSTGAVTVTGDGSVWSNTDELNIGLFGAGTLTIANGGTVGNTTGYVGRNAGSAGAVTVTGTGSTWSNTDFLAVGDAGSGALTVADGGTVTNTLAHVGHGSGTSGESR
jgi:fibronectin-binding autotransporter adhesin